MFTGLIEEIGHVSDLRRGKASVRLTVAAPRVAEGTAVGDSIAINGVCLTVVAREREHLRFDAIPETIRRSSLGRLGVGDGVNLERALMVGQRLGGHFVQGHVDGTGTLTSVAENDNAHVLRVQVPSVLMRYIAPKGSIALDGISLTVVDVLADAFTVWIVPHTYVNTTLHRRSVGDPLNVETDMIAKYVERLIAGRTVSSGLTAEMLASAGFTDD